jgi:hypothetical protein
VVGVEKWKKGLVLLIAVALAGTSVVATQYIEFNATFTYSVKTLGARVQLVASDGDPLGDGYVLKNRSSLANQYDLQLGTWAVGTNKTFTAAFGIVNLENVFLRITRITVSAGGGNLDIYLHENETLAANTAATWDSSQQEAAVTSDDACDANYNGRKLRYYDSGANVDHLTDGIVLEKLASGDGYNAALTSLTYHDDAGSSRTASNTDSPTGRKVWLDDAADSSAADVACGTEGKANTDSSLVWVEITIDAQTETTVTAALISIYFTSLGT